jgi:tripartite-type tricarboxylate transporter receptor subunit TctC
MSMLYVARVAVFAALATTLFAPLAAAQSVADFYKGKTISLVMGTGPGGVFDVYGRTIAEHLGRHIPGNPNIVIEHMPGAGGVVAANHIYGPGPQDGSEILLSHALPMVERMSPDGVRFESAKMHWLGSYDASEEMMAIWHGVPARTLDEFRTGNFVIGSFNRTHFTYQWAMLTKTILGANYKVITGYSGGNQLNLAMERGEIDGWTAGWGVFAATHPDWLPDKKIRILVQYTLERKRELPDVPTLIELTPPDQRAMIEFFASGTPFARGLVVGPGVPMDRVIALRKAFDDLMQDQEFLEAAKMRDIEISPRNAATVNALLEKITSASPDLVGQVMKAVE